MRLSNLKREMKINQQRGEYYQANKRFKQYKKLGGKLSKKAILKDK